MGKQTIAVFKWGNKQQLFLNGETNDSYIIKSFNNKRSLPKARVYSSNLKTFTNLNVSTNLLMHSLQLLSVIPFTLKLRVSLMAQVWNVVPFMTKKLLPSPTPSHLKRVQTHSYGKCCFSNDRLRSAALCSVAINKTNIVSTQGCS